MRPTHVSDQTPLENDSSYLPHWGWSGGQLCFSSVCRHQEASLAHCTLSKAAEDSLGIHFELYYYRAQNLHSLVWVYLSHDDLKLKSKWIQ